jgi:hypothetical protein
MGWVGVSVGSNIKTAGYLHSANLRHDGTQGS